MAYENEGHRSQSRSTTMMTWNCLQKKENERKHMAELQTEQVKYKLFNWVLSESLSVSVLRERPIRARV